MTRYRVVYFQIFCAKHNKHSLHCEAQAVAETAYLHYLFLLICDSAQL